MLTALDTGRAESWRAPAVTESETVLYDEPGRVLQQGAHRVCYGAYHYRLVRNEGRLVLRVKHGAGEESLDLGYSNPQLLASFAQQESDARFVAFHLLMRVARDSNTKGADATRREYTTAYVEGRLRKRKLRGRDEAKVWIETRRMPR